MSRTYDRSDFKGGKVFLENKVSIITGAASGIGKAIAKLFAEEGSDIVLTDINIEKARESASEIRQNTGRRILALKLDVTLRDSVDKMVKNTIKEFSRIDILVNNAGIAKEMPLLEFSEEWWNRIMDVNLKGTFFCIQEVGKAMVKQSSGKIVNISSGSAINPYFYQAAYGPSKAGVVSLTRNAALELGVYGINVNAILPGTTGTEMGR